MDLSIIYAAATIAAAVILIGGLLIWKTPDATDLEVRKLRFAASMFTGILLVFVFAALLYIATPDGSGRDIFKTAMTTMTPLAGAMMGYIFGTRNKTQE